MTSASSRSALRTSILLTVVVSLGVGLLVFYKSLILVAVVAAAFAYILLPVVDWLEQRFRANRVVVVMLVILFVIAVLVLGAVGLFPVIKKELVAIADMVPQLKRYIVFKWIPWFQSFFERFEITGLLPFNRLSEDFMTSQVGSPSTAIRKLLNQTPSLFGGVINVVLIPFLCFFILKDIESIKSFVRSLIPSDLYPSVQSALIEIDEILRAVLVRQLMVAMILACLYMAGLSIVGIKYSIAIGAIAGFCRVIPYLDVVVGVALSMVVIVTDIDSASFASIFGVAIVFVSVQSIDGIFITPRVIGQRVGLHPFVVIASLFAFSDWLGFLGILLAIPIVAICKILFVRIIASYRQSDFFLNRWP